MGEATERVRCDAAAAGLPDDGRPLRDGGAGAAAYAEAVALYLAFALSKLADRGSTICTWFTERDSTRNTFARQSIPMTWDYAELNTLLTGTGSLLGAVDWTAESIDGAATGRGSSFGAAIQADASHQLIGTDRLVSTDPPYYDNIGYADLSDFFYVWLRRSLRSTFPDLFATLAVPKAAELVATPYRHGGKDEAETFFLDGMTRAMERLSAQSHPGFPVTIYYAFKQSERMGDAGTASTGWETFLDAVIRSGFAVTGTWPMRTELGNRMVGMGANALASSIVLVCRRRSPDAPVATRRECVTALRSELPPALRLLQTGNVAPVDLAQAAIGPGMGVYTRYARVLDAAGRPMPVREAHCSTKRMRTERRRRSRRPRVCAGTSGRLSRRRQSLLQRSINVFSPARNSGIAFLSASRHPTMLATSRTVRSSLSARTVTATLLASRCCTTPLDSRSTSSIDRCMSAAVRPSPAA